MYIFEISDIGKIFKFNGKSYRTPCRILVEMMSHVKILRKILAESNVSKVRVENKIKTGEVHGIHVNHVVGSGSVSLSTKIG